MLLLQLILYCLLFTAMVKLAVRSGAVDGLFFYPKAVQDRAIGLGLTNREEMVGRRKRFMTVFYIVMLLALVLIVGVWNGAGDFRTAYFQSLLFLEVMNLYDGVVIDKLWVGHSKFWVLPGTEDLPFVQTWARCSKGTSCWRSSGSWARRSQEVSPCCCKGCAERKAFRAAFFAAAARCA